MNQKLQTITFLRDKTVLKKSSLLFLSYCVISLLPACSTTRPQGKTEDEILYKEAEQYIEKNSYVLAEDKLREVRARFPYSRYAQQAQLRLGDIAFEQENYIESAAAYQNYKDLYPSTPQTPYVLFQLGESFHGQMPKTHDRDLGEAYQAIAYYNQLLNRYPDSQYSEKAAAQKQKCEKMLRDKQQYIADFYFKTKVYEAARFRYKKILREFKDENLLKHAMLRAVESSLKLKDKEKCLRDAQAFLGVLQPSEDETKERLEQLHAACEGL